ncbi:right-handed parallel beta-helix repeat-containing protein [Prevotella sp. MA2016]|uniref:right-handed parallel beta-helix repeat-containing protein n=1 Tax=Prevotella sp. MA2016 TaxID=1408310 RepID=UPI0018CC4582|nr:right-handed parallel beta-helix repeat-containing protein [Prevotella sp. MA2016]
MSDKTYVVSKITDLNGDTLFLPRKVTLVFSGNGCLKNGTIVGNDTKIKSASAPIFDHVQIKGEWVVPVIKSNYFKNITDDDVLKQVFALTSENVHNVIKLESRDYWVTASPSDKFALILKSKTVLQNNGVIRMRPNNLISYAIVATTGHNITIKGGSYIGEREQHQGSIGQWGHGIRVTDGSRNVSISNVNVKKCWGDGIAVDGNVVNTNVSITGFTIDNCRRQGISVIYADNCSISNGVITNIQGTEPYLGIDIEPNSNGYCHNITIDNVTIESEKGIGIFTATKDYQVKNVTIKNCDIGTTGYSSLYVGRCDGLLIINNHLRSAASGVVVINNGVKNCQISSNKVIYTGNESSGCCVFNSAEKTSIKSNSIKGAAGFAFYTNDALICENIIETPEFMTSAHNATGNTIETNRIYGNLSCTASNNTFRKNNIKGNVKLNGSDCTFDNNEILGNTLSGTPYNGQFNNNKVIVEKLFELNGNVSIKSNNIQTPKVMLKTKTRTSHNTFVQTKENDTDSFIALYGGSFEDNIVRIKVSKGSHTVKYIYCTSDGASIKNNKFGSAPGIKYWLYSSKNLKLNNNRPAKRQIFQAGEKTIIE